MIAAPPPYVGGDAVLYNYHQELQSRSMMPFPAGWPHIGGGGVVAGEGDKGRGVDQPEAANNIQSPPVEEINKPPATFGGWVKQRTFQWCKQSDVFGIFLATPEEIAAYAYHERLLVILHIILITLFCSSFMTSIFACPIHRGYTSEA